MKMTTVQAFALANQLREQKRSGDALGICRQILAAEPNNAKVLWLAGLIEYEADHLAPAEEFYRRALAAEPALPQVWNNLGNILHKTGRAEEAEQAFARAISLDPNYVSPWWNLACQYHTSGRQEKAVEAFGLIATRSPDHFHARKNYGMCSLLTGNFGIGWTEYEYRWRTGEVPHPQFQQPRYQGEPLEGKSILLWCEQGLGDSIHFIRYAQLIQQQKPRCVYVTADPKATTLLATAPGVDHVLSQLPKELAVDFQIPVASLPGVFKTDLSSIPATVPYLFPPESRATAWRRQLAPLRATPTTRLVAIAWQGNPDHLNDANRSVPLSRFKALAQVPDVRLVSVQKGHGQDQIATTGFPVVDLGPLLTDLTETAAVLQNVDLLISIDTAVLHLAGALNVPAWGCLTFVPDWRWLLGRTDSPWYPSVRLFRQPSAGDWDSVFGSILQTLRGGQR